MAKYLIRNSLLSILITDIRAETLYVTLTMKRLLFIFFLLLNASKSYSCSCSHKKMTQEEYDNYSLIFIGEIIEVEDCDDRGYQEFTFEIEQVFKGQITKIVSGFNNCGGVCNNLYKTWSKMVNFILILNMD